VDRVRVWYCDSGTCTHFVLWQWYVYMFCIVTVVRVRVLYCDSGTCACLYCYSGTCTCLYCYSGTCACLYCDSGMRICLYCDSGTCTCFVLWQWYLYVFCIVTVVRVHVCTVTVVREKKVWTALMWSSRMWYIEKILGCTLTEVINSREMTDGTCSTHERHEIRNVYKNFGKPEGKKLHCDRIEVLRWI
jgi:hypothetical protein